MLRRKLSAGALRATSSPISSLTSNVPGQLMANTARQQGQQSANLASAVLLNSQRRWKEETVVILKSELKRRGLSQTGNKSALVTRLESADTSSLLPPVPALPTQFKRSISTSPSSRAQGSGSDAPSKPSGADQTPISTDTVTSTGPAVISQKTEAAKTEEIEPEVVDSVPGLPELTEDAAKKSSSGEGMRYSMPKFEEDAEVEQVIPLEPDNFRSNRELPEADEPSPPSDLPSGPKVVTVSDQSTQPGGGPSHAIHDDLPPSKSEAENDQSAADAASDAAHKLVEALPSLGSVLGAVALSPVRAVGALGSFLPPIGAPKAELKDENKEYKANSEPLNGEEKKGMYIFGGIVALGLVLGGGNARKAKAEAKALKAKAGELVGGADGGHGGKEGVKGDDKWAKASGAEIVGHGARKA